MSIDTFTREQFEQALNAAGFETDDLGWIAGERCYIVEIDYHSGVMVRSSVKLDEQSAEIGKDSIRCWLVDSERKSLTGKDVPTGVGERWITRQAGWQNRLVATINKLIALRRMMGDCRDCGAPRIALVSKTSKNPGRVFTKCSKCGAWGTWLDAERIASNATGNEQTKSERITESSTIESSTKQSTDADAVKENLSSASMASQSTGLGFLVSSLTREQNVDTIKADEPVKAFVPSEYQQRIFDFVQNDTRNAVIEAVAGSGKTTTIVQALQFTSSDSKVAFVAFNKHIATELQKRAPEHVHVSTLHSLGYKNIRKALGNSVKVDDRKLYTIFYELYRNDFELKQYAPVIVRLVDLCKATLRSADDENLDYLCDRYGIDVNGDSSAVFDAVVAIFWASLKWANERKVIDYEDMIYLCASGIVPCEQFDTLFVDEAQDLNAAQIKMTLLSGKRIIAVGDRNQSIYGFRGADTDAIPNLIKALDAVTLPLSICYRCASKQVEMAKQIVPQIEARPDAPEGVIENVVEWFSKVKSGDLVLCRTNAPLVRPCYDLIAKGVKATIRGRDIGTGLAQLLDKMSKRALSVQLTSVLFALDEYVRVESAKLIAAGKNTRAQSLIDQGETLIALSDGCAVIDEVKTKINRVFSDETAAITFSSIHRAKGCESERVFILKPEQMPHPMAKQDWELAQEKNLKYVAITRSISELYFVQA